LARADEPRINVNAVTVKPNISALDLTDDFNRANTMLQTPITIKYGYANIRPTMQQKMEWLKLYQAPGSKYVTIDFSKGLVRNYIIEQVKKMQGYQTAKKVEQANIATASTQTNIDTAQSKNVLVIENIDEAADAVISSLKSASALNQQLTIKKISSDGTIGANQTPANQVASIEVGR